MCGKMSERGKLAFSSLSPRAHHHIFPTRFAPAEPSAAEPLLPVLAFLLQTQTLFLISLSAAAPERLGRAVPRAGRGCGMARGGTE